MTEGPTRGVAVDRRYWRPGAQHLVWLGIALLLIAVALTWVWIMANQNGYVLCFMDCGETLIAEHQAQNVHRIHRLFGLLENHSTGSDPAAHPYLYTHNVNIASVLFACSQALGVDSFKTRQFGTLLLFGLGMLYAYRAVALNTGSPVIAVAFLGLLVSTYLQVLGFALNPLRVWHFIAFFGLLFHAGRLAADPLHARRLDYAALVGFAFASFGVGYDYHAICLFVTLFLTIFRFPAGIGLRRKVTMVGLVLAVFILPAAVRQLQVALVLGPEFWARDLFYSIAIKVPFFSVWVNLPSLDQIQAYYDRMSILRPPASPAPSFSSVLTTAELLFSQVSLPMIGLVSWVLLVIVGSWSVGVALRRRSASLVSMTNSVLSRFKAELRVRPSLRSILACCALLLAAEAVLRGVGLVPTVYTRMVILIGLVLAAGWSLAILYGFRQLHQDDQYRQGNAGRSLVKLSTLTCVLGFLVLSAAALRWAVAADGSLVWPRVRPFFVAFAMLEAAAIATALRPAWVDTSVARLTSFSLPSSGLLSTWLFRRPRNAGELPADDATALLAAMVLGTIAGLAIFAPLSLHIYLKHQFPLIIFPVQLAKAIFIGWLIAVIRSFCRSSLRRTLFASLMLLIVVSDHAVVQWLNIRNNHAMDVSWVDFVKSHKNATYAVSWVPNAVAAFADNWVIGIQPGKEAAVADRALHGEQPFRSDEFLQFGQQDAKQNPEKYLHPDYWIFFRADGANPVDSPDPPCRDDYLLEALHRAGFRRSLTVRTVYQTPGQAAPGERIDLGVMLGGDSSQVASLELLYPFLDSAGTSPVTAADARMAAKRDPRLLARFKFNCVIRLAHGRLVVPPDLKVPLVDRPQMFTLPVRVHFRDGHTEILDGVEISVAWNPAPGAPLPEEKPPALQVRDLVARRPAPIVSVNEDHVIFDLGHAYQRRAGRETSQIR